MSESIRGFNINEHRHTGYDFPRVRFEDIDKGIFQIPVIGGSSLILNNIVHNGKIIKLDTAAGTTCILPPATGSGAKFKFVVTVIATSNSHIIKVANTSDTMIGTILSVDDTSDNAVGFRAVAASDTITLNRSTTGSVSKGEWIEITDIAVNVFAVTGVITNTGTPATPFSATV